MKGKALIPLVVGVVVGVFAIKYTMDMVKQAKGSTGSTDVVAVVVARQDIPSTVVIKPEMLAIVETPRTPLLPQDVYADLDSLANRVALKSIPQGVPILPSMIAPEGTPGGLMVRVKDGYRAVGVRIDESSGVGYLVNPTDWVDVLAVMEVEKFGRKTTESRLILERVQVGAVGQVLNESPDQEGSGTSKHATSVTLIVKVDDVPKLHLAQTRGRITLAMRGTDDMVMQADGETHVGDALAQGPSLLDGLLGAWVSTANAAAMQSDSAGTAPVQDSSRPTTVIVVNSSGSDGGASSTERVTFRDDESMEVVEKGSHGSSGSRRGRRMTPPASTIDMQALRAEEDGTDETGPSEVSE